MSGVYRPATTFIRLFVKQPITNVFDVCIVDIFFYNSRCVLVCILQDYTMDIYMRQVWTDNRMMFDEFNTTLVLPAKSMDNVWTPDLFFPNEKAASFHDVTVPNKLMRVQPKWNHSLQYKVGKFSPVELRLRRSQLCLQIMEFFHNSWLIR